MSPRLQLEAFNINIFKDGNDYKILDASSCIKDGNNIIAYLKPEPEPKQKQQKSKKINHMVIETPLKEVKTIMLYCCSN